MAEFGGPFSDLFADGVESAAACEFSKPEAAGYASNSFTNVEYPT